MVELKKILIMEQNTKTNMNNEDIQLDNILERINGIFG